MNVRRRIAPRDLSFPNHSKLMEELNDFSIAVKAHYIMKNSEENSEQLSKIRAMYMQPTWENVCELLNRAIGELQECRHQTIKY